MYLYSIATQAVIKLSDVVNTSDQIARINSSSCNNKINNIIYQNIKGHTCEKLLLNPKDKLLYVTLVKDTFIWHHTWNAIIACIIFLMSGTYRDRSSVSIYLCIAIVCIWMSLNLMDQIHLKLSDMLVLNRICFIYLTMYIVWILSLSSLHKTTPNRPYKNKMQEEIDSLDPVKRAIIDRYKVEYESEKTKLCIWRNKIGRIMIISILIYHTGLLLLQICRKLQYKSNKNVLKFIQKHGKTYICNEKRAILISEEMNTDNQP